MNPFLLNRIAAAFLLSLVLVAGCDKANTPPAPISVQELSPALEKIFAKAKPEAKELAAQIATALQAQDYSTASLGLQTLCGMSGLSKEQANLLARGTLCVNTALQAAQAQGDKKAADILRWRRATK